MPTLRGFLLTTENKKSLIMQITLNLHDDIINQIQTLTNKDDFVNEAIKNALKNNLALTKKLTNTSKWALLAERVDNNPTHLAGYSEQLKKDMREFRENCDFHHDAE